MHGLSRSAQVPMDSCTVKCNYRHQFSLLYILEYKNFSILEAGLYIERMLSRLIGIELKCIFLELV